MDGADKALLMLGGETLIALARLRAPSRRSGNC